MSYISFFQGYSIDNKLAVVPTLETNVQTLEEQIQVLQSRIQTLESKDELTLNEALAAAYPIGSVYISVSATSPGILFGGEWERIATGRCLIGAGVFNDIQDNTTNFYGALNKPAEGTSHPVNERGGQFYNQLLVTQIPSHTHVAAAYAGITGWQGSSPTNFLTTASNNYTTITNPLTGSTGGNQSHNNMPPYLAVYMWKRIN